jgi:hypothetical protein
MLSVLFFLILMLRRPKILLIAIYLRMTCLGELMQLVMCRLGELKSPRMLLLGELLVVLCQNVLLTIRFLPDLQVHFRVAL